MNTKPAIFLDRDGVINKDFGYISKPEQLVLLPKVKEALLGFKSLGYYLIIVSNQSGIARGYFTEEDLNAVHSSLKEKIGHDTIDLICYCPHLLGGTVSKYAIDCDCRKPKNGMIISACENYSIEMNDSYLVGDKESDMDCAIISGLKPVFITENKENKIHNYPVFASLYEFYQSMLN